jgi:hypothetical protein
MARALTHAKIVGADGARFENVQIFYGSAPLDYAA